MSTEPFSTPFVNPNDVTVQHGYCLHVLHSTLLALKAAQSALQTPDQPELAANFLCKYDKLLQGIDRHLAAINA